MMILGSSSPPVSLSSSSNTAALSVTTTTTTTTTTRQRSKNLHRNKEKAPPLPTGLLLHPVMDDDTKPKSSNVKPRRRTSRTRTPRTRTRNLDKDDDDNDDEDAFLMTDPISAASLWRVGLLLVAGGLLFGWDLFRLMGYIERLEEHANMQDHHHRHPSTSTSTTTTSTLKHDPMNAVVGPASFLRGQTTGRASLPLGVGNADMASRTNQTRQGQ